MNVLLVSMQKLPAFGGVNSYVSDLTTSLRNLNINVDILSQSDISNLPESSLNRINKYQEILIKKAPNFSKIIVDFEVGKFALKELLRRVDITKYDLIHSQDGIFSKACKEIFPNVPLVGTIHGSFVDEYLYLRMIKDQFHKNFFSRFDSWAVEYPDIVITPSIHLDPSLPSIPSNKRKIINHGINTNQFKNQKKNFEKLKIVTASSLYYYKGLDILMEALIKLQSNNIEFSLEVYGDGPERVNLERISIENKLPIDFKGKINRELLPDALSKANIFVQASRIESFGLSVTEAMASGCVPVCSAIGGLKEQIKNLENGILFESENSNELYKKLKFLNEEKESFRIMSENAELKARETYNMEKMALATKEIYNESMLKNMAFT